MTQCVLVTGGAGYIGSHTCLALHRAGYAPVVLDDLSGGHRWAVKWGPLVEADISDRSAMRRALETHAPLGLIHFAGSIEAGLSVRAPLAFWSNNVAKTCALLEAVDMVCPELPILFSSSAAVYGAPSLSPIPETAPLVPVNPYGDTKLAVEWLLAARSAAGAGPSAALRYFNACGAEDGEGLGEAHDPETHLIPLVLEAALGKRPRAAIFGTDYPTPDGTCIRDYVHVADLARAHVMALDWLRSRTGFHAFNVGTGRGWSVAEVIAAAKQVTGVDVPVDRHPRRAGDPPSLVADPSRIRTELGFHATASDLDTILASAWRWAQRQA